MPRTLEGLRQPAQLHGKATPQIKRVSSCKPRVSVSEVAILKRQGLQFAGRSCRPSQRRVSSPGYLATFFQTKRNKYTKSAARGEAHTESFRGTPRPTAGSDRSVASPNGRDKRGPPAAWTADGDGTPSLPCGSAGRLAPPCGRDGARPSREGMAVAVNCDPPEVGLSL